MDFAFGEAQDLLRSSTRRFVDKRQSLSERRTMLEEPETFDPQAWREAAELGWTSMLIPSEFEGGSVTEQPLVDLIVLGEELGRVLHPGPFVPTNVVADAIARWGTASQRAERLAPIARGESVGAWCLTGDGSIDPARCEVQAERHEGGYTLEGVARFVHGATVADVLLVLAHADAGYVHLLVPTPAAGVSVRAQQCIDLTRRFGEVRFDQVSVAADQRLVTDPDDVLHRALSLATVLQAAEAVGAAGFVFDETVSYLKDRVQFGRTIGSFQAVKHKAADQLIALEGMRAATRYAALALNEQFDDAPAAVSTAGAYVGDAFAALCGEALQLHGGIGFTWEHDVHLYLRRAINSKELYGDPSWHREQLCAMAERA